MTVHRLATYHTADPFTRVPNEAVNDPALDLKARGLLLVMLSKPDGWAFSEDRLATDAGVSQAQIRTAMKTLMDAGYVRRSRVGRSDGPPVMTTHVYDMPQDSRTPLRNRQGSGSKPSESKASESVPLSNEGEINNGSSNEGTSKADAAKPTRRPRATRIPENFQPDPEPTLERPVVDVSQELAKFCDYWRAKPGQGGTKLDWQACWRNWLRNAARYQSNGNGRKPLAHNVSVFEEGAHEF